MQSTFIKYALSVLFLMIILSSNSYASQTLWPTDLRNYGDCMSARITAPMNDIQRDVDKLYCSSGQNAGKPDAIKTCIENSSNKTEIVFFNDLCALNETGKAYISINGKEYIVTRTGPPLPNPSSFDGTYEGDDIKVVIATNDIEKTSPHKISVTVSIGTIEQKIYGIFIPSGP